LERVGGWGLFSVVLGISADTYIYNIRGDKKKDQQSDEELGSCCSVAGAVYR
jgi:hypothetical protein